MDVLGLAERLYAAEVESVFSLQLNQFVTGCNVSHENPITLDVPGLIHRVVRFDKKTLVERNIYLVKKEQIMKEREAAAQQLQQSAEAEKVAEAKTTV